MAFPPKVAAVVLFGSESRGVAGVFSYIDLSIICDEEISISERSIVMELCEVDFPTAEVQLTYIDKDMLETERKLEVGYEIKREGLIIYERQNNLS
jgi:predicted nucleotidyltransferase